MSSLIRDIAENNLQYIELVIKIPKELYEGYKGRPPMLGDAGMDMIAQSITNGKPLPKGHGRLIDADYSIKQLLNLPQNELSTEDKWAMMVLTVAPTIIERSDADAASN